MYPVGCTVEQVVGTVVETVVLVADIAVVIVAAARKGYLVVETVVAGYKG